MGARRWRSAFAALLLATMTPSTFGQLQQWTVQPSVSLRGTYTDNVSLAAAPDEGEFATTLSPAIRVSGRSARLSASLSATANAIFYARNDEENRLANTLSGTASLEAVENFFFVDAQANVSQTTISPFGDQPSDLTTITDNRTETRTVSLSPYVRSRLPGGYTYELRNRNTWTNTDSGALAEVHTRQWTGNFSSPIALFGWSVDASDTEISYEDPILVRPDQETRHVTGRLFFQPKSTLRLSASAGREENNYSLQEERSYDTYGYGILWRPTPRTSLEFDWESRFFGIARRLDVSHRHRRSAWSLSYSKDVSTFQQELLRLPPGSTAALLDAILLARFPDPIERAAAVQEFLQLTGTPAFLTQSLAFYTEQVSVEERLQGSLALLGARNSITFTVYASESTRLTDPGGTTAILVDPLLAARVVKQHGFGLSASHRLSGFTSVTGAVNTRFAEPEDPPGPESRHDTYTLGLNRQLSPRTNAFGGLTYSRSRTLGASARHARSAFVGLTHFF